MNLRIWEIKWGRSSSSPFWCDKEIENIINVLKGPRGHVMIRFFNQRSERINALHPAWGPHEGEPYYLAPLSPYWLVLNLQPAPFVANVVFLGPAPWNLLQQKDCCCCWGNNFLPTHQFYQTIWQSMLTVCPGPLPWRWYNLRSWHRILRDIDYN